MTTPTPKKLGPSWREVAALQGAIQGSYGGFCVVVSYTVLTGPGFPRTLWYANWGPSILHAHVAHYRGYSGYWPDRRFTTVPELLWDLLQDLDKALHRDEDLRAAFHQPPLRSMVLPAIPGTCPDVPRM